MRNHPIVSLFAAALITLAPMPAFAQDVSPDSVSVRNRPRPEVDPLGKRLGGFDLHARLDLGLTSTDNVFAEETSEDDDMIYTAGVHGRLTSHWSRNLLEFEAGADTRMHADFDNEDADTHYFGVRGRFDIGSNSNLSGLARTAHEVESRLDPDAPTAGDPVEYDRQEIAVRAEHRFNRFRVAGTLSSLEYDYDAAQNFRDNEEQRFTGRVEAAISPRVGVVVQASTDERDYDNLPGLNSEGTSILAGATINMTDLMIGEVTVGQFERDYDNGETVDGTAVEANLEWYVTRLTTVTLNASRDGQDTGSTTVAEPYVETDFGARVDHELLRNVIVSASARSGTRDYDALDREDEYRRIELEARYMMNRRVELNGRLSMHETESSGANRYRDFEETRFTLGASLRL